MAEFVVESVDEQVRGRGLIGTLSTVVDGVKVELVLGWAPDAGVVEWWAFSAGDDRRSVVWALSSDLASRAAEACLTFAATGGGGGGFSWSPPVEWGVLRVSEDPAYDVVGYETEGLARRVAGQTGDRVVMARVAAGPWVAVDEGGAS